MMWEGGGWLGPRERVEVISLICCWRVIFCCSSSSIFWERWSEITAERAGSAAEVAGALGLGALGLGCWAEVGGWGADEISQSPTPTGVGRAQRAC